MRKPFASRAYMTEAARDCNREMMCWPYGPDVVFPAAVLFRQPVSPYAYRGHDAPTENRPEHVFDTRSGTHVQCRAGHARAKDAG
jgi:hypothetical protein